MKIEEMLNKFPDNVRKSLYGKDFDLKPLKQQIMSSFSELRTNLDAACDLNKLLAETANELGRDFKSSEAIRTSLETALKQSEENCRKQVGDLRCCGNCKHFRGKKMKEVNKIFYRVKGTTKIWYVGYSIEEQNNLIHIKSENEYDFGRDGNWYSKKDVEIKERK
ncbi:MAG: hypothetical protein LLG05_09810 [Porphyromonadaceae bacterium]|nr:hypothetical protein [Porphyromonadaceae bacterium]